MELSSVQQNAIKYQAANIFFRIAIACTNFIIELVVICIQLA